MKTYTVVGIVNDYHDKPEPWMRVVRSTSPARAGIKGIRMYAKENDISIREFNPRVVVVLHGECRSAIYPLDPLGLTELKKRAKR